MLLTTALAALMWLGLVAVPWRPWSTRETLLPSANGDSEFPSITVLIPARDEAGSIGRTLAGLAAQGRFATIFLIDDQSSDGTAEIARAAAPAELRIIDGSAPPPGWSGKLWALQQGYAHARTEHLLLIDADIELDPGTITALWRRMTEQRLALVSVMARLHVSTTIEKLLLPPFIYFFKLIYPFALSNNPKSSVAAAAGGLILLEKARLDSIGGFHALQDAIIDDCTLARLVKRSGGRTWLGLSQAVRAVRPYATLGNIWNMVARTAFTQLHYSLAALLVCSVLLVLSFIVPVTALFSHSALVQFTGLIALSAMGLTFLPTVRYYDLAATWAFTLPLAACLYLAMTWTSAVRYWSGERSRWKNRSYDRQS